jgi:hypothetical protein
LVATTIAVALRGSKKTEPTSIEETGFTDISETLEPATPAVTLMALERSGIRRIAGSIVSKAEAERSDSIHATANVGYSASGDHAGLSNPPASTAALIALATRGMPRREASCAA